MLLLELNNVRPNVLYYNTDSEVALEWALNSLHTGGEILTRTRNTTKTLSIALNSDVLLRKGYKLNPVPGGERADGRTIKNPIEVGAVIGIYLNNEKAFKFFNILKNVHNVPMYGYDQPTNYLVKHWDLFKNKNPEEYSEPVKADRRPILKNFFGMSELEQVQLLSIMHFLNSWLEGWQMQEGYYMHYARLFTLLQKAVVPRYGKQITEIYRYAFLEKDLSGSKNKKLLTSTNQFQSWTTASEIAKKIAYRNALAASSPTRQQLTIFKANTNDVDVIATAQDILKFIEALQTTSLFGRYKTIEKEHSNWYNGTMDNLSSVKETLESFFWQDEVIVRSPVNRKIPAEIVSVGHFDDR